MSAVLVPLLLGVAFGWALQKAGLTQYARIVGVYRLRDLTVVRFMLTALVVAAVLDRIAVGVGLASTLPVPPTTPLANLVGGVVFGVGMATAGYCPGTIVAEAGEGRLDALLAGVPGLVAGAVVFGLLQPRIMPPLTRAAALGPVTLASVLGVSPWLALALFVEVAVGVLYLLARRPTRAQGAERGVSEGAPGTTGQPPSHTT